MTYAKAIDLYQAGLISYKEVCKEIDFMNMGSDCYFYEYPSR